MDNGNIIHLYFIFYFKAPEGEMCFMSLVWPGGALRLCWCNKKRGAEQLPETGVFILTNNVTIEWLLSRYWINQSSAVFQTSWSVSCTNSCADSLSTALKIVSPSLLADLTITSTSSYRLLMRRVNSSFNPRIHSTVWNFSHFLFGYKYTYWACSAMLWYLQNVQSAAWIFLCTYECT